MTDHPAPLRGRSKRGGLGKYLRARGRRGGGRAAEFGKRLVLEGEEEGKKEGEDNGDQDEDEDDIDSLRYAKRQLGTNADRYEEPEVDLHDEQEPEPEVDLSSFLARQRLAAEDNDMSRQEDDNPDDIDHTLSNMPSKSSHNPNSRKNKIQQIEWDESMDELKREKEAAEAVWDLKSRFRKNQPRLVATHGKPSPREQSASKVEDARHIRKPPDAEPGSRDSEVTPGNKADLEEFLDDLLG